MRKHLLTVTQVTNGYIVEVNNDCGDWVENGNIPQYRTYVAKTPEEVLASINKHLEIEQLPLPL